MVIHLASLHFWLRAVWRGLLWESPGDRGDGKAKSYHCSGALLAVRLAC